jgi:DNA-binding transcriptional ArsR family regulator
MFSHIANDFIINDLNCKISNKIKTETNKKGGINLSMTEKIKSIYKKKSYKRLRPVLEFLYSRYWKSEGEYISTSDLAKEMGKDISGIRKALKKFELNGIVDIRYPEGKKDKAKKGGKIRILYRLSQEAYNIIRKTKTAQ